MATPGTLDSLRFEDVFVRELPGDSERSPRRRMVRSACYSHVQPTPVAAPKLVVGSAEVAQLIGLDPAELEAPRFAQVFSGNELLPGMTPYAACYGGHQFGNWAGQLGDGRAMTLGEAVGADGTAWELQLKGAGPTPYSRSGDGRAVLRSSLREFICSEAMHHLGVPTTRALSLVLTGDSVVRDMFYDGNARPEPGAIVCRVAPSFVRFGSFEILAAQGDVASLRRLADHTIKRHFPGLVVPGGEPGVETYAAWFGEVCQRTAAMIVEWMRVGFVHGVMNTDNMSVLGLTIDYGPYGWLEGYDPDWTPNTTDAQRGRYRYGQQPQIGLWNLVRFANALVPLVGATEPLEEALAAYSPAFEEGQQAMMASKLGLERFEGRQDAELIAELVAVLQGVETDMPLFYRGLAEVPAAEGVDAVGRTQAISEAYYAPEELTEAHRRRTAAWLDAYAARVRADGTADAVRRERMNAVNPLYCPRNYLAQVAIDAAEGGDFAPVRTWLEVLRRPYTEQAGRAEFAGKRPEWARHRPGCSMLSCSS